MTGRLAIRQLDRWHAESTDGIWTFERQEDRGSTWSAYHGPEGEYAGQWPSLRKIRKAGHRGLRLGLLEQKEAAARRADERTPQ